MQRSSHHLLTMISDILVMVCSFVLLYLSFPCIRRVVRRRRSWANLTVFENCTFLMCRCRTLELAFYLELNRSWLISLYSLIASGEGG